MAGKLTTLALMNNRFLSLLFYIIPFIALTQRVVPFVDFNYYFRSFENDNFRHLELQPIDEYKAGDDLVAYIDTRGNLRVWDGQNRQDISNMNVKYQVSDYLMAYTIGPTLNVWDQGKLKTLTSFSSEYVVKDSLVIYQDTRFNTVNAYWNKQTFELYRLTDDLYMPEVIGENIVAFRDNGNFYKIFWRGKIYDIGVWNGTIDFQAGTDVLCFNDPTTRTFAIFENGNFVDVESFWIKKYKAGRGFIVYEDLNGNIKYHSSSETLILSNFTATFWEVKDDLVVWGENSFVYAYQNGQKLQVANFSLKDFLIKNNVFAFRNVAGGVSALVNGKVYTITNQADCEYEIYGNVILVKLLNRSFIVFKEGKEFRT
jgi:hypothetical protein